MTVFPARLKEAMEAKGIRAAELSALSGISPPRISQYIHGKYTPGGATLCRLSAALDVSEAWLMGREEPTAPPRATVLPLPDNITPLTLHRYPILGRIACGQPILAVEDDGGEFVATTENDADFCLTAQGDSMIGARIYDGDEVFIRSGDMVNNGDIAAVVVDDEATLKRVYYYPEEGRLILSPENPAYAPMEYTGEALNNIHILGRAVAVQTKL